MPTGEMALPKIEIKTYYGQCKCCLDYNYLRNMWEQHFNEGEREIYGKMLVDCFGISWTIQGKEDEDKICEVCVSRLREASRFKSRVLLSQKELLQQTQECQRAETQAWGTNKLLCPEETTKAEKYLEQTDFKEQWLKSTREDAKNSGLKLELGELSNSQKNNWKKIGTIGKIKMEWLERAKAKVNTQLEPTDLEKTDLELTDLEHSDLDPMDTDVVWMKGEPENEEGALEVEFLEDYLDDDENQDNLDSSSKRRQRRRNPEKKRLPKSERWKTYRQYTEDDLQRALKAVRTSVMTPREASEAFHVPRKTIAAKIRNGDTGANSAERQTMLEFIKEIKTVLIYMNVTPFKTKANNYFCAFCPPATPWIEEAEQLREHVRTEHTDRINRVEHMMRPHYNNEAVKMDIKNLTCNVCKVSIQCWDDMFAHIKTAHDITLVHAQTRLIPFALEVDMACTLCDLSFSSFMNCDSHMNTHYKNYICGECGDTFLTQVRLNSHVRTHRQGVFPCDLCDKVFSQETYRKKHTELMHEKRSTFKCYYCELSFLTDSLRQAHMEDEHQSRLLEKTCKICGKVFKSSPAYNRHVRVVHNSKHVCHFCKKSFECPSRLNDHLLRHTGEKKYQCEICNKMYASQRSLQSHLKIHESRNDGSTRKIFQCEVCSDLYSTYRSLQAHLKLHKKKDEC